MKVLKKAANEDFVILNLTDTQITDGVVLNDDDNVRTILENTVTTLVERVKPDLITVSGDLAYGDNPNYKQVFEYYVELFNRYQIRWSIVWGNHDNQGGKEPIVEAVSILSRSPYFVYENGNEALGNGNYVIAIEEDGKIVEGLIMIDGHDKEPFVGEDGKERLVWAKLLPAQLAWYEEEVNALKKAGCNDTAIITHIPIYAYKEAFMAAFNGKFDKNAVTVKESYGSNCWNEGYEDSVGVCYEAVSSYPEDEGAFDLIRRLNSTKTVICGHDHINNTIIDYRGVKLVYSLKTGRGCYWHKDLNGGTVIRIGDNGVKSVYHEYVELD